MRLILLAALLSGCATTPEVVFTLGPRYINETGDTDVAASIAIKQRFGAHGVCQYVHQSEPQHGAPFNDFDEITSDHVGCGVAFGGNPR